MPRTTSQRYQKSDVEFCIANLPSLVDTIYEQRPASKYRTGKDKGQVIEESRRILKALLRSSRKVNGLCEKEIHWKLPEKKTGQLGYGRYVGAPGSVDVLVRELRHIICHKYCVDIDIVNCHPVLLYQMAEQKGVSVPNLEDYVKNREDIFERYATSGLSRDDVKGVVHSTLYGGNLEDPSLPSLFFGMEREIKKMVEVLLPDHQDLWAVVNREKKYNKYGSFLANIAQREERRCLDAMVDCVEREGWKVDTLCADGFHLRIQEGDVASLMSACEEAVHQKTGYRISLVKKDMKPIVPAVVNSMPAEEFLDESVLVNDKYAWEQFVSLMGENLLCQDGQFYTYHEDSGMWEVGRDGVVKAVLKLSEHLVFKQSIGGTIKVFDYGGCTKHINNMLHNMNALSYTVKSTTNIHPSASRMCLLFANGWYDMSESVFHEGFDTCRTKYFTSRIKRDFCAERDSDMEEVVRKTLFRNPYNNPTIGDFYANGISRAIAGLVADKSWWSIVGRPDCGKGVMALFLKYVFDEYVGDFNMNVLKHNPNDGTDEAKRLAWFAPLVGCRLAIGNEVRIDGKGLDGNLIKTLSSGGDVVQLRQNFQNQYAVRPVTTFFAFCNDLPPITPCDEALKNRMNSIPHMKTFVNKAQEDCTEYEMQSDPALKDKIASPEWIQAFFWILMDAFAGGVRPEKPSEVREEVDELFQVEDDKIKELLQAQYEFVDPSNEEAYVAFHEISKYLRSEGVKLSDTGIGKALRIHCKLRKATLKIDKKATTVYHGVQKA